MTFQNWGLSLKINRANLTAWTWQFMCRKEVDRMKRFMSGQGLVEYALILVLVAIVVLVSILLLGPFIGNAFSDINSSLSSV
jgi:pilus assembly protein Flp/PilA